MQLECPHEIYGIMIEGFYIPLLYRNNNRIKKLFACIIYVYCSDYICGSIFIAGKNVSISYSLRVIRVV
jgi:hypothetical protein